MTKNLFDITISNYTISDKYIHHTYGLNIATLKSIDFDIAASRSIPSLLTVITLHPVAAKFDTTCIIVEGISHARVPLRS